MRKILEEKPLKKGKVKPGRAKRSPAQSYDLPLINTVATLLEAEEPEFLPVYVSPNVADVKVIVPSLNHLGVQEIRLNHRAIFVFDCGFKMVLPKGYRLRGEATKEWADNGLLVNNVGLYNDRLKITVINVGNLNPLIIPHKAVVAGIWVEPVYFFEFNSGDTK